MSLRACRGTSDILPHLSYRWRHVENAAQRIADLYGYEEIRTPIFEYTELFVRGIGGSTDIVEKEMFTFTDRSGRSLTLRPEGTAPVARAFAEHHLDSQGLSKVYYIGPFFRYERPQSGRSRQFHQFGIEALGSLDPSLDTEVILMVTDFFSTLGMKDLRVDLNSIGCRECRPKYKETLISYFGAGAAELCPDCLERLQRNPLRVLDCKKDISIARTAPSIVEYLCASCSTHFNTLQENLKSLEIPYKVNPFIVRGLDYYTRTVFEVSSFFLGAQNALCGGGRYDDLVEELGGPPTPAVGVAIGLERTILVLENEGIGFPEPKVLDLYFVCLSAEVETLANRLLLKARRSGLKADRNYLRRGLKAQLRVASRLGARFCAILGEDELKMEAISLRDMRAGSQEEVPLTKFLETVKKRIEDRSETA